MGRIKCGDGEDGEPVGAHRAGPDGRQRAGQFLSVRRGTTGEAARPAWPPNFLLLVSKCLQTPSWWKTKVTERGQLLLTQRIPPQIVVYFSLRRARPW